jgi:DNA-binding transcriptional LysR family regulator
MPMFELERYIHVLSAIRKHNSFRAAAQELNISPSALSKQLNQLEGKYNVECVDRDTRTLTAYGDILVDEGGKGLAHFRNAFIQVENLRGIANKEIVVSSPTVLTRHVSCPSALAALTAMPDLHLRVDSLEPVMACREFNDHKANVILGYPEMLPCLIANYQIRRFPFPMLSYVCSPDHPLAGRECALQDAIAFPIVGPRPPIFWEEYFRKWLLDIDIELPEGYDQTSPVHSITANDWSVLWRWVSKHQGLTGGVHDEMVNNVTEFPMLFSHLNLTDAPPFPTDQQVFIAWDTDSPQVMAFVDKASEILSNATPMT